MSRPASSPTRVLETADFLRKYMAEISVLVDCVYTVLPREGELRFAAAAQLSCLPNRACRVRLRRAFKEEGASPPRGAAVPEVAGALPTRSALSCRLMPLEAERTPFGAPFFDWLRRLATTEN